MSIQVSINIAEIYKMLCPKCKKKVKKYIESKLASQIADKILQPSNINKNK